MYEGWSVAIIITDIYNNIRGMFNNLKNGTMTITDLHNNVCGIVKNDNYIK